MILLHNREWMETSGVRDQGQKQRDKLSTDAFNALSASLHGGVPKRVDSRALLQDYSTDKSAPYTVLISPLFDGAIPRENGANGSLVQLIPEPHLFNRPEQHGNFSVKDRRSQAKTYRTST